jgi:hypothetical protein
MGKAGREPYIRRDQSSLLAQTGAINLFTEDGRLFPATGGQAIVPDLSEQSNRLG